MSVLGDKEKRHKYDNGQDLDDINMGGGGGHGFGGIDPNDLF